MMHLIKRPFLAFCMSLCALCTVADEGAHFVEAEGSRKYAVILVGAAVDERRAQTFGRWAFSLRELLRNDYGYREDQLRLLIGDSTDGEVDGDSRLDSIRSVFQSLAKTLTARDQLTVVLIGHGSGRGEMAKFNIVGPDISGPQFAELLNAFSTPNIVVINTTSASHDFSKALAGNGRVVVSATRSPAEKYDTVFPEYFVNALQNRAADRDKNGRISVLEAFNYAKAGVESYFNERSVLPTERAVLDDNGDGVFSDRADAQGDGRLAEVAYLDVAIGGQTNLSPAAATLHSQMTKLERQIFRLRNSKSQLSEADYWAQLEPLLIELAKVTREFDDLSQP